MLYKWVLSKTLSYLLIFSWIIFAGINLYPTADEKIAIYKKEYYERVICTDCTSDSYERIYGYADKWIYALWYRAWVIFIVGIVLYLLYIRYKSILFYFLSCSLGVAYCFYITGMYNIKYIIKGLANYGFVGFYDHLTILLKNDPSPINELILILFILCMVFTIATKKKVIDQNINSL